MPISKLVLEDAVDPDDISYIN